MLAKDASLSRLATRQEYRSITSRVERGAKIRLEHNVTFKSLVAKDFGSLGSLHRGVTALSKGRIPGVHGHPCRLTAENESNLKQFAREQLNEHGRLNMKTLFQKVCSFFC